MGQSATTKLKGLGKIHISDFWKSIFLVLIVNILMSLYTIINSGNWPTLHDIDEMIKPNVAIFLAYIIKNISTNNVGEILKKDKPTVAIDVDTLNDLKAKAEAKV